MTAPMIAAKLHESLHAADALYYRLVLLAGGAGSGKTGVLRELAGEFGVPVVNVNLELSGALLELTPRQRPLRLSGLLADIADRASSPLILDNLEMLFDRSLQQDPLRLLQSLSRNRAVLAAWNGKMLGGRLLYAEPGHPEYRCYDAPDALIVGMDGSASIDSPTLPQGGQA